MDGRISCFHPELLAAMGAAYDTASRWLDANMRPPPHHDDVARLIVLLAMRGMADKGALCGAAIQWFYLPAIIMTDSHNWLVSQMPASRVRTTTKKPRRRHKPGRVSQGRKLPQPGTGLALSVEPVPGNAEGDSQCRL